MADSNLIKTSLSFSRSGVSTDSERAHDFEDHGHTRSWRAKSLLIWLWVKKMYPKWNPGKWKRRLEPADPGGLILTHTHFCLLCVASGLFSRKWRAEVGADA